MHKPLLIDGFKFDLRIYVNINGIAPLRVYVHKNGLARFATVPYQSPAPSNMKNMCMHLTNFAINKESDDFQWNNDEKLDDKGSKRSYRSVLDFILKTFGQERALKCEQEINEIILKTICIT